jgi:hypothetical protein
MSLAEYSETQQKKADSAVGADEATFKREAGSGPQSVLLLSISAAADFYSTNKALMDNPPPVLVDIILDPFLYNVFPRSLVATAGYIVVVAIGSIFVARFLSRYLANVAKTDIHKKDK